VLQVHVERVVDAVRELHVQQLREEPGVIGDLAHVGRVARGVVREAPDAGGEALLLGRGHQRHHLGVAELHPREALGAQRLLGEVLFLVVEERSEQIVERGLGHRARQDRGGAQGVEDAGCPEAAAILVVPGLDGVEGRQQHAVIALAERG
jgi:hypothetical protein